MSEGYPSDWDSRRREVYQRDNYICQNCGAKGGPNGNVELHAHHIVPKKDGGTNKTKNLQTLCKDCHDAIHHKDKKAPTNSNPTKTTNSRNIRKIRVPARENASEPNRPIRKECPFCYKHVRYELEEFVSHWASDSMYVCDYSPYKDEPESLEFEIDWDEIAEKVRKREEGSYPRCPYCRKKVRDESAKKYISHWTNGGCDRVMESPPTEKPDEIDEEMWNEINEKWDTFQQDGTESNSLIGLVVGVILLGIFLLFIIL